MCAVVRKWYEVIKDVLREIGEDPSESTETRRDGNKLVKKRTSLEMYFMALLWDTILKKIDKTSKYLQCEGMELAEAVKLLEALYLEICSLRDKFEDFERKAKEESGQQQYKDESRRKVARKKFSDESPSAETSLIGSNKFLVETFNYIIDK